MQRLAILKAMLFVAFIAAHLAVLRALISTFDGSGFLLALLVGLLPLAEAQLVGLCLTVRRYRFTLKRRNAADRGMDAVAFSAFNAAALILLSVVGFAAPETFRRGFFAIAQPIQSWFRLLGYTHEDYAAPYFRLFVSPIILGAVMSGPQLLLGLAFGWLANRYELVISRRSATPMQEHAA
jgi:hypothetical protein